MKKGISLIVLVITIIVMIIIAGAIILSLNSSNVTGKANWATVSSDRANLQAEFAAVLADSLVNDKLDTDKNGVISKAEFTAEANKVYSAWTTKVGNSGFVVDSSADDPSGFFVKYTAAAISGAPTTNVPTWYTPAAGY